MPDEVEIGPASELTPGTVTGAGRYAVGNAGGELFAVTRRCRHLYADLAKGSIDEDGCLVCPWHGSRYNVETGRMVRGPQGAFDKIPGLGTAYKALTVVLPLGRGRVVERDGTLYVE
jgi:nitrite reductase/ring-hydroxylating ferredoxin subunit